jgi:hypothetical protein
MGFGVDDETLYVANDTKLNKEIVASIDTMEESEYADFLNSLWSFQISNLKLLNEPITGNDIYAVLDNTIQNIEVSADTLAQIMAQDRVGEYFEKTDTGCPTGVSSCIVSKSAEGDSQDRNTCENLQTKSGFGTI